MCDTGFSRQSGAHGTLQGHTFGLSAYSHGICPIRSSFEMERHGGSHRNKFNESAHHRPGSLLHCVSAVTYCKWLITSTLTSPHSAMFVSTVNILTFSLDLNNSSFSYILNACGNPPLVCVTRNYLLIHLKEAGEDGMTWRTSDNAKFSSMNFARDRHASGMVSDIMI